MKSINKVRGTLILLALVLIVLFQGSSFSLSMNKAAAASSRTLVVPDSYSSISLAISSATPGDQVFVKKGVYRENPLIDKAISIKGEDNIGTIVVGSGGADRGARAVFNITSKDVTLSGFTIQSLDYSNTALTASGINIGGDGCKIIGNVISGTYYGIFSSTQSFLTISQNTITSTLKDGVRICGGSKNTISNNVITKNAQSGIALDGYADTVKLNKIENNYRGLGLGAAYSTIFGNNFNGNTESGLYVASSDSFVVANNMTQSKWGIHFTSFFAAPNNNTFYSNNILNNTHPVGTTSTYNKQIWNNENIGNYWGNSIGTGKSYEVYTGNSDVKPLTSLYVLSQNTPEPTMPTLPASGNGTVALWHFDEIESNGATPDAIGSNTVVLEPTGNTFTPILVNGKVNKALQFNGTDYAYVTISPALDIQGEITIDAWVNVQEYKENVDYNNIFIECMRTPDKFPTRILGFSFNGKSPQNSSSPQIGALRGFLLDDKGVFNEIVTKEAVVPLNQWVHVVFVRSLTNGMHIYVNGQEKEVQITSGIQSPSGAPAKGTEFYIGHDSLSTIDELTVSTAAMPQISNNPVSLIDEWWFWTTVIAGTALLIGFVFFVKKKR